MESGEAYIVGRQEFWFESPCKTSRATAKYSAKWHEQERFELKGSEVTRQGPKRGWAGFGHLHPAAQIDAVGANGVCLLFQWPHFDRVVVEAQ
jgi:hypothetical protein